MNISPNEIESIEDAGELNMSPVKLLRTKGGFYIAIGKQRGKMVDEALAAGSHPAIVKYNLQKQYPDFHPSLMKSEGAESTAVVEKHTKYLSEDLQKSGHDVYSVQTGANIEFQFTKYDVKVGTVQANIENDAIVVKKLEIPKEFSHALAGAVADKAVACGASKIGIKG